MTDLAALRARHPRRGPVTTVTGEVLDTGGYCVMCHQDWPCDAILAADRIEALEAALLDGGLLVPGFDHWRVQSSSKPSDPGDIRWDCSCGYAGSPETVRRHWAALRRALLEPNRRSAVALGMEPTDE